MRQEVCRLQTAAASQQATLPLLGYRRKMLELDGEQEMMQ